MKPPLDQLAQAFAALQRPLALFESALHLDAARMQHVHEVRVDDGVTQLFVDLDKEAILWRMSVASHAIIHIKALCRLAGVQTA